MKKICSKSLLKRVAAFFLALNMCFWMLPIGILTARAEGGSYITDITLMQGDLSIQTLEGSGYKVIEQSLNPSGGDEIHLGYNTGGEGGAIRDIIVSSNGGGSITVDGNSYQRVSDISLNSGAGGTSQYMYVSRDEKAGEPIKGISFFARKTSTGFEDDSPILASDGSEVVITDGGKIADFDEGIGGSELYLRMYKGDIYRPYVEKVVVATADSEEAAIEKLAGKRCTYYINYDIGDDKTVMLGYTRTSDVGKALRGLVAIGGDASKDSTGSSDSDQASASDQILIKDIAYTAVEDGEVKGKDDYRFYVTTDEKAGEPIIDLVACGYDPEDFGLMDMNKEAEPTQSPEPTEEAQPEDQAGDETEDGVKEENDDTSEEAGEPEEDKNEEPVQQPDENDQTESPDTESDTEADTEETASLEPTARKAASRLMVVGLDTERLIENDAPDASDTSDASDETASDSEAPVDKDIEEGGETPTDTDEESSEQTEEINTGLAKAYRLYTEIEMKDWISGYYLRGGGKVGSKYLYDESGFISASESSDKLWLSNIYCSNKKGKQFVNDIGYITMPGSTDADPFEEEVPFDQAEEYAKGQITGESTASVFGFGIGQFAMFVMIVAILSAIIISLGYKLYKLSKSEKRE